ncbi:uncharacterized protein LOC144642009 [Oculina patagonica]
MKSEKHNSTKYLPGITTRKPQLRNSSWAKLLSQDRSYGKDSRELSGLDVCCTPVLFNLKETSKTCQNPVENLADEREEKLSIMEEVLKMEENIISGNSFDDNVEDHNAEKIENDASGSLDDEAKFARATSVEQEKDKQDRLPPLADMASTKHGKVPKETFYRRNSKGKKDCLPSKTKEDIDWQNIFVNGGFRPYESRDLPTRGELKLLKYKTWDLDGPVYCVTKCAKYFGLDNEIDKGKPTPVEKEPRKRYTSPSPNYKFYPLRVPKRHKSFPPLENPPESLTYLENPAKQYNLCNSCVVPPVTPASPMFRSSPLGWSLLPYKDRTNTLGELAEMTIDKQNTDEGIGSPTESELGW